MSDRIDLADPDFEPTDEQLQELSHRAFAGIKQARAESRAKLRAEIAAARVVARTALAARRPEPRTGV
jgi:4'-phosphopantetheinyl transferase EntD